MSNGFKKCYFFQGGAMVTCTTRIHAVQLVPDKELPTEDVEPLLYKISEGSDSLDDGSSLDGMDTDTDDCS
jgi:hypothetical protein